MIPKVELDKFQANQTDFSEAALDENAVQAEIRIVQSVQNQRNMPALLIGSISAIILIMMIDFGAVISTPIIYLLILELLLLLPMARSYLKLLGRPFPKKVSKRRIRTIEIYTLIMGLVWMITTFLIMSNFSQIDSVAALLVMFVLSYGAPALSPSLPRAAFLFVTPVMLACFLGALLNDVMSPGLLTFLCVSAAVVMLRTTFQSWQDVNVRVRLGLENLKVEADRARVMEQVSTRLGKYMSPQLYKSIFTDQQEVEIASQRKKLTVFFSDIASFTEITEELEAEQVTELLNRYLTEMSKIVEEHDGTIDKFIGDAIVVYFGDPESRGVRDDALACVKMAVAMQQKVRSLHAEWTDLGLERTFDLRIGINTGYCTVGNFGSADRMDYTIIGSEVNLAARLESAADVGGILLSNETFSLVKDWVAADDGVPIKAKGFPKPINTFRVQGLRYDSVAKTSVIRHEIDGLSLMLDVDSLDGADKMHALELLTQAVDKLNSSHPPE